MRRKISLICVPCTSSSGYYGFIFPVIKRLCQIPYIVIMHGGGMKPWKRFSGNKALFLNADRIVAVSEIIRQEYQRRCNRSIKFIPPLLPFNHAGYDRPELKNRLGLNREDKVILVVGSLKPIKGSDVILDAFLGFESEFIDRHRLKLVFAGDGPLRPLMEKKIRQFPQNSDAIKLLGIVDYERIPEIYGAADLYVIASKFEGTPISLLEAMFKGLPIVASNVTGINNIITDARNGLLFDSNDPFQLAKKIQLVLEDEDLAHRLGAAAHEDFTSRYDFRKTVDAYRRILEEQIGKGVS